MNDQQLFIHLIDIFEDATEAFLALIVAFAPHWSRVFMAPVVGPTWTTLTFVNVRQVGQGPTATNPSAGLDVTRATASRFMPWFIHTVMMTLLTSIPARHLHLSTRLPGHQLLRVCALLGLPRGRHVSGTQPVHLLQPRGLDQR